MNLTKNLVFHAHTKHIEIHYHFVRGKVSNGTMMLESCSTKNQVVDILTKGLSLRKFEKFR
eukprot:c30811_g1_i1 orf=32-214(+)